MLPQMGAAQLGHPLLSPSVGSPLGVCSLPTKRCQRKGIETEFLVERTARRPWLADGPAVVPAGVGQPPECCDRVPLN
jgi:hypothetical protein